MKTLIILLLSVMLIAVPAASHGFGLFKYVWDGIGNQLGLDRGPVPKATDKGRCAQQDPYLKKLPRHVYFPSFHLQAHGY